MDIGSLNGLSNEAQAEFAGSSSTDSSFALPVVKQDFLKILVHQMKNQDPFAAAESGAFLDQMAQFSSLEQMQNLTSQLGALLALQNQNAAIQDLSTASGMIGKEIVFLTEGGGEEFGKIESVSFGVDGTFLNTDGGHKVPLFAVKEVRQSSVSSEG